MNIPKKNLFKVLLDTISIAILLVGYILYFAYFSEVRLDFSPYIEIDSGHISATAPDNSTYIIDKGKDRIVKLTDGKVEFEIKGNSSQGFYQAENIAFGNNNEFYVHSVQWDDSGFLVANEKIIKYNSSGKYLDTIYKIDYNAEQEVDKHQLFDLRAANDGVEFIKADESGFKLINISAKKDYNIKQNYEFDNAIDLIQNFATDVNTGNIYIADKRGKILCASSGKISTYSTFADNMVTPYSIAVGSDGSIYFSDVHKSTINKILPDKSLKEILSKQILSSDKNVSGNEGLIFTVSVNSVTFEDGSTKDVISTIYDNNHVYSITQDGQTLVDSIEFEQSLNYWMTEVTIYVIAGLCILSVIYLIFRVIRLLMSKKLKLKLIYKVEIVIVLTTIIVSLIIIPIILPSIKSVYKESLSGRLLVVSTIASNNLDPNLIESVKTPSDFMNEDYKNLVNDLQKILTENIEFSERMGAQIEKYENGVVYSIAYPNNAISSYYPVDKASSDTVKTIYDTKQPVVETMNMSEGLFISARTPIINSNGEVIAVINVAKDSIIIDSLLKQMLMDIVINLIFVLIVAIFILNEIIAFISQRKIYKNKSKDVFRLNGKAIPFHFVRVSEFVFNMTLSISSCFLPVYVLTFYSEQLGIPKTLAGTIPLFINSAFITISALASPYLLRKFSFKTIGAFATICALTGAVIMACTKSYYLMVFALLLNGLGYGLLDNSINTCLTGIDKNKRQDAVSMCGSSGSAGSNCGIIIGAFLASVLAYNQVFYFSAFAWLISLFICVYIGKYIVMNGNKVVHEQKNVNIFKFIFSKSILSYILLISMTYGIISGFISYYVPIYGSENNLSEKQVSLILIIGALCTVFLKVPLTNLAKNIFNKKSIYIAIVMSLATLLVIATFNNSYILTVGVLILGLIHSFGGNVCMSYFLDNNKCRQYGQDKSLGVYNLSLSLGKSGSSTIFATIIAAGVSTGMSVFAGISFAAMLTYRLFFDRKKKNIKEEIN